MNRRKKPRRGVVLLLVISLLVLFVLIAATYAIVAGQYRNAAFSYGRRDLTGDNPRRELDQVMYMLLRDTPIVPDPATTGASLGTNSSIKGHSLLADLYGISDIVSGTVAGTITTNAAGGQFMSFGYTPAVSSTFATYAGSYNGAVLTMLTGKAKGFSTFIVGYTPGSAIQIETMATDGSQMPNIAVGDLFLINGRAFNGTGIGYNSATQNVDAADTSGMISHPYALMPHYAGYPSTTQPAGNANESYDAVDYQNMFLAKVPANANSFNDITPSFHRPDLIAYWINADSSAWGANPSSLQRQVIFRPLQTPQDHPNFTGSNPSFTNMGPWDVDNDGDGIVDSIWIDPGLPVVTGKDGRRYKRLAAILCRDLDGRININAADCFEHSTSPKYSTPITGWFSAGTTSLVPRGLGVGPADISFTHIFSPQSEYQNFFNGIAGPPNYPGRYGTDQRPGFGSSIDPISSLKFAGVPTQYPSDTSMPAKQQSYGSPPDLRGQVGVVLDYNGQPIFDSALPSDETLDNPYEKDPLNRRREDNIFSLAELERLLRYNDVDAKLLPSRLLQMAPNTFSNATSRSLVTTQSVHIPVPNVSLPFELRSEPSYTNLSAPTLIDLYRIRLKDGMPSASQTQIEDELRKIVPFEMLHGQLFDINRLFGNGQDDDGNGVPDDYHDANISGGEKAWPTTTISSFQGQNFDYYNDAQSPPQTPNDARQLYARHLYCLVRLLMDKGYVLAAPLGEPLDTVTPLASGYTQAQEYTYKRIAQWAINVVDFRDRDSTMTCFEFDLNPFDGWQCDGNPSTATEQPDRGVVWGAERPDLLITESLAFHNRRVKDTQHDDAMHKKRYNASTMMEEDPTIDQFGIPQGSLYLELYCTGNPQTNNKGFSQDLYDTNGNLDIGRLAPARTSAPAIQYPVWRAVIIKNPGGVDLWTRAQNAPATSSFELSDLNVVPDRMIWFANTSPTGTGAPEESLVYYARSSGVIPPGNYLVVGPRADTRIGSDKTTAGNPVTPSVNRLLINGGIFSTNGNATYTYNPNGYSIQTPLGMICAADPPAAWVNKTGIGLNISEPVPVSAVPGKTYYPEPSYGQYYCDLSMGAAMGNFCPDIPFDANSNLVTYGGPLNENDQLQKTGTQIDFRTILLQRLANPKLPWNPDPNSTALITAGVPESNYYDNNRPINPYITVDWGSIDLTVFSGDEDTNQNWPLAMGAGTLWIDPNDQNPYGGNQPREQFASRERGNAGMGNDDQLWPPRSSTPQLTSPDITNTADYFTHVLRHTLGFLNSTIGTPQAYGGIYNGSPQKPFPWYTWNNRPFANPMELMLVPACSPSRAPLEFGLFQSGAPGPYGQLDKYYSYLLPFFHSAASGASGQFSRLFDYVETPSLFVGTEKWYSPAIFASNANAATFRPPFNRLSRFRDPGRININTIFDREVFDGLMQGFPSMVNGASGNAMWNNFVQSRQGFPSYPNNSFPSMYSNPFRSAASSDLMPIASLQKNNVEATLLRSSPSDSTKPLFDFTSTSDYDNTDRNPYFRLRGINRLSNLVTNHSNVYAIWITVGYFEVEKSATGTDAAHPDGYQLGQEVGLDSGNVQRHRAFYIIDRSIPVAFQPGQDHNVDRTILVRRLLD